MYVLGVSVSSLPLAIPPYSSRVFAQVHYMNDQALSFAAAGGHADVVDQLLALGAYIRADNDAVSA